MFDIVGYLFILFLIFLMGAFLAISMHLDYKRINKKVNRELQKLEILEQMIQLKDQINTKSSKYLKEGSFEYIYLSQIDLILNNPYQLDEISITPINFKKSGNGIDREAAAKAYRKAHKCVRADMDALSEILGKIYQLKHPLKYKLLRLKKIITVHILGFLVAFLAIMIEILEKWCETNKKSRIAKMKKRQKAVQNVPASVWLNISPNQGGVLEFA